MDQLTERELLERIGLLERQLANVLQFLTYNPISSEAFGVLMFSNERNDKRVQDVGFSEDIEDALHRQNIFKVSQILNLGRRWLNKMPGIGYTKAEQIKQHLADIGALLPD